MKRLLIIICALSLMAVLFVAIRNNEKDIYDKYNGMKGIVIRSQKWETSCSATIVLNDGTIGNINTGDYLYKIGNSYTNELRYSFLGGTSGYAYFIIPDSDFMLLKSAVSGLIILLFIVVFIYLLYHIFENGGNIKEDIESLKSFTRKAEKEEEDGMLSMFNAGGELSIAEKESGKLSIISRRIK